jgi:hypothetical protein
LIYYTSYYRYCEKPDSCSLLANSEVFPEGFKPVENMKDIEKLIVPSKAKSEGSFMDKLKSMIGV